VWAGRGLRWEVIRSALEQPTSRPSDGCGASRLTEVNGSGGVGIRADRVSQLVRGGRQVLSGVSLAIEPGRLVAVIGASGAGKTLLLEALAGVRQPSGGSVRYDGANSARARVVVGYVPQDDIVHRELPLATMLRFAARLRLPATTSRAELRLRVDDVMATLGLSAQAGVPVRNLSGGERKRASIGVELLARPQAFFLDEPTSGLDPLTASGLVAQLRQLATTGVAVVLTTHNAADVAACDQVLVLGNDGKAAFSGTPEAACLHFGVGRIEDIYVALARRPGEPPPPTKHPPRAAVHRPAPGPAPDGVAAPVDDRAGRSLGPVPQCLVLAARTAAIVARNRLTLGILIGSPVIVLAMFLMLFRAGAFDPATVSPSTSVMIVFWIAFGGFFFGLTYGLLQICTELAIFRRERLTGVRLVPYVLSKILVLLPMLAAVDLLLLGLLRILDRLPAVGVGDFSALYVTLLLATAAALGLGLLCSAAVSDVSQATLALPMLCFPQVLFVGAILPVPLMAPVGRWLSYAMSNRWSFEALGHTTRLPELFGRGASPLGPPLLASYGDSFDRPLWQSWCIIGGFTLLFVTGACLVLAERTNRVPIRD
jgi:ABC-type multidrug transport system ATPase subunit